MYPEASLLDGFASSTGIQGMTRQAPWAGAAATDALVDRIGDHFGLTGAGDLGLKAVEGDMRLRERGRMDPMGVHYTPLINAASRVLGEVYPSHAKMMLALFQKRGVGMARNIDALHELQMIVKVHELIEPLLHCVGPADPMYPNISTLFGHVAKCYQYIRRKATDGHGSYAFEYLNLTKPRPDEYRALMEVPGEILEILNPIVEQARVKAETERTKADEARAAMSVEMKKRDDAYTAMMGKAPKFT